MERMKRLGALLYKAYVGVGITAMGGVALLVIVTVIARYFFSLSWMGLDEFMNVLFAFTTFWGMGVAVIEGEHVAIEILYGKLSPRLRRWVGLVNALVSLAVVAVVGGFSIVYIGKVGMHPSPGMGMPMKFLYGIMTVGFFLCAACIVLKSISLLLDRAEPDSAPRDAAGGRNA